MDINSQYEPNIFYNSSYYDRKSGTVKRSVTGKRTVQPIRHEKTLWYLMTADPLESICIRTECETDVFQQATTLLKKYFGPGWEEKVLINAATLDQWPSVVSPQFLTYSLGLTLLRERLKSRPLKKQDYEKAKDLLAQLDYSH